MENDFVFEFKFEKGNIYQLPSGKKLQFKKDTNFKVFKGESFYKIEDEPLLADVFCEDFKDIYKKLMEELEFLYNCYGITQDTLSKG